MRQRLSSLAAALLVVFGASLVSAAQEHGICGPPPPAPTVRKAGGEGAPPLPIDPGVAQRRTENKRTPSPPPLLGKLGYGKQIPAQGKVGGQLVRYAYWDWDSDPGDMTQLLRFACSRLGLHYGHGTVWIHHFSFSPKEVPILYMTGHVDFTIEDKYQAAVKQFILDGGYLLAEACCGKKPWGEAFERLMKGMFPDRPFRFLPPDHPIYHACYEIDKVRYTPHVEDRPSGLPALRGINIGCRTAVIFSPYDLSCGWDGHSHPWNRGVTSADARKLGTNIIAYCLATVKLGDFLSKVKVNYDPDERAGSKFVFAQLRHSGDWNPNPSGTANLLKELAKTTSVDVKFRPKAVRLTDSDVHAYPFLYMTGHLDFKFSAPEAAVLRKYLERDGFLLVDNCCGRAQFDIAFRRELKKVFPDRELALLEPDHPALAVLYKTDKLEYAEPTKYVAPDLVKPHVEGISIGGNTVVIYNKYGLGNGWEGEEHPYASGVAPRDSLKLATNLVLYAMTH